MYLGQVAFWGNAMLTSPDMLRTRRRRARTLEVALLAAYPIGAVLLTIVLIKAFGRMLAVD